MSRAILLLPLLLLIPHQEEEGRKIYRREKCGSCHGNSAVDLFKGGPLWSPAWTAAYLSDPKAIRPSTKKKAHAHLDRKDLLALGAYIASFQHDRMKKRSAEMSVKVAPPKTFDRKEGAKIYRKNCACCHGEAGKGDGPLSSFFTGEAMPRAFVRGRFRRKDPAVADIYLAVTRGMPGSGMGAFDHLSERERWLVADYIFSFSPFPPEKPRKIPEPKPSTPERVKRGYGVFMGAGCRVCHGGDYKGRVAADMKFNWRDEDDRPLRRSRDLTSGIFRTGSDPRSLYRGIFFGRGGTPMPSYADSIPDEEDRWALIAFIRSLFQKK